VIADLLGLAALLAIGLVVAVAAGALLTAHRLTHAPRRTAAWAASRGVPADPGELDPPRAFTTRRETISGRDIELWEIEGDSPNGPTVIVTPGWGDSKLSALARLDALAPWAARVVAWDPPGFGATNGVSALGVREPLILKQLCATHANNAGVVLYGWSLGGGASVVAGGAPGVIGVIAEAPYRVPITPARNVLRSAGLPHRVTLPLALWLLRLRFGPELGAARFDRAAHAESVGAPLLVLHGTADAISPIEDGRAIAARARLGTIREIEGGGHNDLWSDEAHRAVAITSVRDFASRLTGIPAASSV